MILVGASVRAAAFSALRAGLRPWCADLFADTDLAAVCPVQAIPAADYPEGFLDICARAPDGPWMYTGGLENRPALVEAISQRRTLWGNGADVLRRVRSPVLVAECLRRACLAYPEIHLHPDDVPARGRWLVKPVDGTGGRGIGFWSAEETARPAGKVYYQEYVEGEPCSAVYLGYGGHAYFRQATRQLVGEPWLHAAPFHYCGSVGPPPWSAPLWRKFRRLGETLARTFGLRGLFGVDCVLRAGVPWVVEVNPRYPASVEILELRGNPSAVELHNRSCAVPVPSSAKWTLPFFKSDRTPGKAILFARESLVFPGGLQTAPVRQFPLTVLSHRFADIPPAGQHIERGRPILTFFAEGASVEECIERLRQIAADLDRWLFDR
ncbi:MAG TPA: ATP-grasp domain-containing protein [Gemmataceae bacterium]|nr:ATP-grasp domain-containing protein [Gemmataceae bacterium]